MVELDSEKPGVESLHLTYTWGAAINVVVQVPRVRSAGPVGATGPTRVPAGTTLNTKDYYYGGFELEDIKKLLKAMESNYKAWCLGFASLMVGGDIDSVVVQEFNLTLFNTRPDIALSIFRTIFESNLSDLLPYVTVPCYIIRSSKDLAVPVSIAEYLHRNLGEKSINGEREARMPLAALWLLLMRFYHYRPYNSYNYTKVYD
ncbi:hypothetical protein LguiB_016524 [Lonicera macranthoides]